MTGAYLVIVGLGASAAVVAVFRLDRLGFALRFLRVRFVQQRIVAGNRRIRRIMARNARRHAQVQQWIERL